MTAVAWRQIERPAVPQRTKLNTLIDPKDTVAVPAQRPYTIMTTGPGYNGGNMAAMLNAALQANWDGDISRNPVWESLSSFGYGGGSAGQHSAFANTVTTIFDMIENGASINEIISFAKNDGNPVAGVGSPGASGDGDGDNPGDDPGGGGGGNSSFPSFATLLSNYPLPYSRRPDRTPRSPNQPVDDNNGSTFLYYNQCAIRVSISLKESGVSLSGAKNYTNPGGSPYGDGYILGATNLAKFLRDKYLGAPEIYDGTKQNVLQSVQGRQGIIYFQNFEEQGSHGMERSNANTHIELWDRNHYMSTFPFSQMFGGTTIWFWPLK